MQSCPPKSAILKLIDAAVLKTLLAVRSSATDDMVGAIGFTLIFRICCGLKPRKLPALMVTLCSPTSVVIPVILPVRALTDKPVGNPTAVKLSGLSEPVMVKCTGAGELTPSPFPFPNKACTSEALNAFLYTRKSSIIPLKVRRTFVQVWNIPNRR